MASGFGAAHLRPLPLTSVHRPPALFAEIWSLRGEANLCAQPPCAQPPQPRGPTDPRGRRVPTAWDHRAVGAPCHSLRMDNTSDLLLLHAVQAWCDECQGERILVPVIDDLPGGFCCTVCDTAVFSALDDLPAVAALRRSA